MKKHILLIGLFIIISMSAQDNMQWRAVFQYKQIVTEKEKARRDSLIKAQPAMADLMKSMYKRFENRTYIMNFNQKESIFKEEQKLDDLGKNTQIRGLKDRKLYKNIPEGIFMDKRPLMNETFIILDSLPKFEWKISNESKQIGKYTVVKAEAEDPYNFEKTITAWFTPEIAIKNGPKKYWGLPGFIMEVSDGKNVFLCKEITLNPKDKIAIKKPVKGKIVNEETFQTEMIKMREKMQKMYKNRRGEKSSNHIEIRM